MDVNVIFNGYEWYIDIDIQDIMGYSWDTNGFFNEILYNGI